MSNNKIIINDDEYKKFLIELKEKVKNSQLKAAVKVNYELLDLYWNLGQNLKNIRYWYLFYSKYLIGLQAVSQLKNTKEKIKSIPW